MKQRMALYLSILALLFLIFGKWFAGGAISSGDSSFRFIETLDGVSFFPSVWNPHSSEIGSPNVFLLALHTYYMDSGLILLKMLHLPWDTIIKLLWYFPFIFVTFFSSRYFLRTVLPELSELYTLLGVLLYLTNSYILMVVGGGQIGVGMAYAVAPLVLATFIRIANSNQVIKSKVIKSSIIAGLLFSVQVMLDPRLAYITLAAVGLYVVFKSSSRQVFRSLYALRLILYALVIPLTITGLLHAFWLLPFFVIGSGSIDQLSGVYTTGGAVQFFSFAKLENAISLLHPNWPENIFGKVYFMRWEFLILPLLAYSSLLFLNSKVKGQNSKIQLKSQKSDNNETNETMEQFNNRIILFFALLGLIGAFLAKGANEPFGQLYLWMFDNMPGFIMFRDPTKFYLLISLAYSILVPFSIYSIYKWFNSKLKIQNSKIHLKTQKYFSLVFFLLLTSYFLYLIHPALLGQLGGTFKPQMVPEEYVKLKDFLVAQPEYSRTIWMPLHSRYAFYSNSHPRISANDYLVTFDNKKLLRTISSEKTMQLLQDSAVKYVIVPYDSRKEIFIKDRKYDERIYENTIKSLEKVAWLKRVDCSMVSLSHCSESPFGKIAVYEVPNPKDLFWSPANTLRIEYGLVNPTKYTISVNNAKKGDMLVFAESYDTKWIAKTVIKSSGYNVIKSARYNDRFNSFVLPEDGDYQLEIFYEPQKWVDFGLRISLVALILVGGSLVVLRRKQ